MTERENTVMEMFAEFVKSHDFSAEDMILISECSMKEACEINKKKGKWVPQDWFRLVFSIRESRHSLQFEM